MIIPDSSRIQMSRLQGSNIQPTNNLNIPPNYQIYQTVKTDIRIDTGNTPLEVISNDHNGRFQPDLGKQRQC